jgi:predicted CopG family antitoxin
MENITTINIKRKTHEKLAKIGQFGQSFDDVINALMSEVYKND